MGVEDPTAGRWSGLVEEERGRGKPRDRAPATAAVPFVSGGVFCIWEITVYTGQKASEWRIKFIFSDH